VQHRLPQVAMHSQLPRFVVIVQFCTAFCVINPQPRVDSSIRIRMWIALISIHCSCTVSFIATKSSKHIDQQKLCPIISDDNNGVLMMMMFFQEHLLKTIGRRDNTAITGASIDSVLQQYHNEVSTLIHQLHGSRERQQRVLLEKLSDKKQLRER